MFTSSHLQIGAEALAIYWMPTGVLIDSSMNGKRLAQPVRWCGGASLKVCEFLQEVMQTI
jgi:hypothetical protein